LLGHVEVVSESYAVAKRDGENFVLAVGIEGCPMNSNGISLAPIKPCSVPIVADLELSSVGMRKTNDKGSELSVAPRSVNVSLEFACWA
jgi:hypothetical protein